MARIPTFEAGEGALHPSDAGSAAFREAGAITQRNAARVGQMISQTGTSIGGGISALGGAVSKIEAEAKDREQQAQDHTDAMAMIDFQNKMTSAQIAAMGGVNAAGTPTSADGTPINNHPGRGGDSLPPDANVPSPGSFAVAASDAITGHQQFSQNALDNIPPDVSPKMRDKMSLEAAKFNNQLQVQAAAVANEVALTHATHATQDSINKSLGALENGTISLPIAMYQVGLSLDSLQGSLTGEYAAKGAKAIETMRTEATKQAIRSSIKGDLISGNTDNAIRTLNDPQWNSVIGGQRDEIRKEIGDFQNAQIKQQETQRRLQREGQKDAALEQTDKYMKDPNAKIEDIMADHTYDNRADLRKEAIETFNTIQSLRAKQFDVSPMVSTNTKFDLLERMTLPDGDPRKITDRRAIDQAMIGKTLGSSDYDWLLAKFKTIDNPTEKRLHEFEDSSKDYFNKDIGLGMGPLTGELSPSMARYQYLDALHNRITEYKNTPGKDWTDLINPNKPDYMGDAETLDKYKKPLTQAIQEKANGQPGQGNANTPVPVPKGTTPDQLREMFKDKPGQKFIIEREDGKKYIGTAPGKQSMNYAPEGGGMGGAEGQQAISGNMSFVREAQSGIRNQPIAGETRSWLQSAGQATGLVAHVFSGGQSESGPNRTGSHRHDDGGAADVKLYDPKSGRFLNMNNPSDAPRMAAYVRSAVAAGATGIGGATGYMGPESLHIGGGSPGTWGSGGHHGDEPAWLRQAWAEGMASRRMAGR